MDGYSSISTTGSIRIGDDPTICDDTYKGTIRFNSTTSTFEGCNGVEWVSITPTPTPPPTPPRPPGTYAIGDEGPAGGIVFYITEGGLHGLEAAWRDQGGGMGVNARGCYRDRIYGADGVAVGTGAQNTADIIASCDEEGIAARLAAEYGTEWDSDVAFDGWHLPSKDELNLLWQQKDVVGRFTSGGYWSSTMVEGSYGALGWVQYFSNGSHYDDDLEEYHRVRAVRPF